MRVARILKGKTVHPDVSLLVAPGSRQVFEMIVRDGGLTDLLAAGARIMESACGFCIGSGAAPQSEGVSLRTNNRNFEGRSGTQDAKVFLVSPETAAVSAIAGTLTDPIDLPVSDYPDVKMPDQFLIDDSMVLEPAFGSTPIFRGPNIGDPPYTEPLKDEISGVIGLKVGDKITTDHIMPAGQRLKYRSNIPAYARYVFENVDQQFSARSLENKAKGLFTAILAGESYGQGSSLSMPQSARSTGRRLVIPNRSSDTFDQSRQLWPSSLVRESENMTPSVRDHSFTAGKLRDQRSQKATAITSRWRK
jgi:aconitate hydratase